MWDILKKAPSSPISQDIKSCASFLPISKSAKPSRELDTKLPVLRDQVSTVVRIIELATIIQEAWLLFSFPQSKSWVAWALSSFENLALKDFRKLRL